MIKSVFLFFVSVILFLVGCGFLVQRIAFLSKAEKVVGQVSNVASENDRCSSSRRRRRGGSSRTYYDCTKFQAEISFNTLSGQYSSFVVSAGTSRGHNQPLSLASYRNGDPVPVLYDPKDLSTACRDSFMDKWGTPFMVFLFQFATMIGSVFGVRARRRQSVW